MKQVEFVEKGLQTLDDHNDRAIDFLTSIFHFSPQRARPGDLIGRTCILAVHHPVDGDRLVACRIQGIEFQSDLNDQYPRKLILVLCGCPLCTDDGLYRVSLQQTAQDTPPIIEPMWVGYAILALRILD